MPFIEWRTTPSRLLFDFFVRSGSRLWTSLLFPFLRLPRTLVALKSFSSSAFSPNSGVSLLWFADLVLGIYWSKNLLILTLGLLCFSCPFLRQRLCLCNESAPLFPFGYDPLIDPSLIDGLDFFVSSKCMK